MAKRRIMPIDFEDENIYGMAPLDLKEPTDIPDPDFDAQSKLYEQFRKSLAPDSIERGPASEPLTESLTDEPISPPETEEIPELSELDKLRADADRKRNLLNIFRGLSRAGQSYFKQYDPSIKAETPILDEEVGRSDIGVKRYLEDRKRELADRKESRAEEAFQLDKERTKLAIEKAMMDSRKYGVELEKHEDMMGFLSGTTPEGQQAARLARGELQAILDQRNKNRGIEREMLPDNLNLLQLQEFKDFLGKGGGLTEYQQATLKESKARREFEQERWSEGEERRVAKEERKEGEEQKERARKLSKDITARYDKMKADPVYKEMAKQGISFDQADDLLAEIEAGNEVALGAVGTKMARAMGEVGVLTDKDVERYVMAQSIVQKAKDKFGKAFMGQLSAETLKDIKDVTAKMSTGFRKKKEAIVKEYVDQTYENFGKDAGISRDDIYQRMFGRPETAQSNTVLMESPDGERVRVKRDKVDKYLQKGAKVVE